MSKNNHDDYDVEKDLQTNLRISNPIIETNIPNSIEEDIVFLREVINEVDNLKKLDQVNNEQPLLLHSISQKNDQNFNILLNEDMRNNQSLNMIVETCSLNSKDETIEKLCNFFYTLQIIVNIQGRSLLYNVILEG